MNIDRYLFLPYGGIQRQTCTFMSAIEWLSVTRSKNYGLLLRKFNLNYYTINIYLSCSRIKQDKIGGALMM